MFISWEQKDEYIFWPAMITVIIMSFSSNAFANIGKVLGSSSSAITSSINIPRNNNLDSSKLNESISNSLNNSPDDCSIISDTHYVEFNNQQYKFAVLLCSDTNIQIKVVNQNTPIIKPKIHKKTNRFEDLPIIHTGCDTYASIYPEFKHFNRQATVDEVVDHLLSLTPNGKWVQDNGQDVHVFIHPISQHISQFIFYNLSSFTYRR